MKKKSHIILFLMVLMVLGIGVACDSMKVHAAMVDEAESYELGTEYHGRTEDYPERYFSFYISEKSYVSLSTTWKVDSVYDNDCEFMICSDTGMEVLKAEDVYNSYNNAKEAYIGTAGRILPEGTYYLQVGTGSGGSCTRADFSFIIQAEKQVKLPRGVVASLKSPAKGKIVVSCRKCEDAIGYRILISTDYTFKKGTKTIYAEEPSKTINGLKKGTRYYVKVCPYSVYDDGTYIYGQNSKVKSVKVK